MIKAIAYVARVLTAGLLGEVSILCLKVKPAATLPVRLMAATHWVLPPEERSTDVAGQTAIRELARRGA